MVEQWGDPVQAFWFTWIIIGFTMLLPGGFSKDRPVIFQVIASFIFVAFWPFLLAFASKK